MSTMTGDRFPARPSGSRTPPLSLAFQPAARNAAYKRWEQNEFAPEAEWSWVDVLQVANALRDPRWDFRTVEGICSETGIPLERVSRILATLPSVRKSLLPDRRGRELFTDRRRPVKMREWLALLRAFIAKTPY